jgi:hypothetical protein
MKKICAKVVPKDQISVEKFFQQHWWKNWPFGENADDETWIFEYNPETTCWNLQREVQVSEIDESANVKIESETGSISILRWGGGRPVLCWVP